MTEPRQIYSSSLSRRDRAWRRTRRRSSGFLVPLLARLTGAGLVATTVALFVLPHFGG